MLEWIVFIVLFLVFYVVAAEGLLVVAEGHGAIADQRRPKKVKQEWRPSEEMYVVNDEFNVTHWLGTDVEIAKMYMEPGWKLGKGSPKGWKWETYETIYPYSSKCGPPSGAVTRLRYANMELPTVRHVSPGEDAKNWTGLPLPDFNPPPPSYSTDGLPKLCKICSSPYHYNGAHGPDSPYANPAAERAAERMLKLEQTLHCKVEPIMELGAQAW
jgi:hypothetical protein